MSVPFLDLNRTHQSLMRPFLEATGRIISASSFVNGPDVTQFEEVFAAWVGTRYCVGTASGLDALTIALRTLGVGLNSQSTPVIVPAMTFIATVEAVLWAGGSPILVDVDENGQMNLEQVEEHLKQGVRHLIPVHLYGQLVSPEDLLALSRKYNAIILEDACQAHGAKFQDFPAAGGLGNASAFSFYPGKNLGALGDGGAICTNDESVWRQARALREHGQTKKYFHDSVGYTSRLDTLQAAFLQIKLERLNDWTTQRIDAAGFYIERLHGGKNLRLQSTRIDGSHVYHLFVIYTEKREELAQAFSEKKIGYGFHYPNAIHQLACFKEEKWANGHFPNAERIASAGISLPIFPGITREEQDLVIQTVRSVCG